MADYTPYQKKIIKRYYENSDAIGYQRLAELTSEIYLAEGKKLDRLWTQVGKALEMMKVPASRSEHVLAKRDPKILAELVKELTAK
ncbi:MAG: hypothetical protein U1D30_15065 [Planctomycetota bacterium]